MITATVKLSNQGQVLIPEEMRESLHWGEETELTLIPTQHGVLLQENVANTHKIPVKSLRGFLQHIGKPVSTEKLCRPIEYTE